MMIEENETRRIIDSDRANQAFIVEIYDNPVRISHDQQYVKSRGTTLREGTHRLSNLRGQELYAIAHEGNARLRVNVASSDVDTMPERDVTVLEGDVQIDDGTVDVTSQSVEHYSNQQEMIDLLKEIRDNTND